MNYQEILQGQPGFLWTVTELAQSLRVDPGTVRKWIKYGVLRAIALPHPVGSRVSYRIAQNTVDEIFR